MTKIKLTRAQGLFLLDCADPTGATAHDQYPPKRKLRTLGFIRSKGFRHFIIQSGKDHLKTLEQ